MKFYNQLLSSQNKIVDFVLQKREELLGYDISDTTDRVIMKGKLDNINLFTIHKTNELLKSLNISLTEENNFHNTKKDRIINFEINENKVSINIKEEGIFISLNGENFENFDKSNIRKDLKINIKNFIQDKVFKTIIEKNKKAVIELELENEKDKINRKKINEFDNLVENIDLEELNIGYESLRIKGIKVILEKQKSTLTKEELEGFDYKNTDTFKLTIKDDKNNELTIKNVFTPQDTDIIGQGPRARVVYVKPLREQIIDFTMNDKQSVINHFSIDTLKEIFSRVEELPKLKKEFENNNNLGR